MSQQASAIINLLLQLTQHYKNKHVVYIESAWIAQKKVSCCVKAVARVNCSSQNLHTRQQNVEVLSRCIRAGNEFARFLPQRAARDPLDAGRRYRVVSVCVCVSRGL